jgi:hypothetical protein
MIVNSKCILTKRFFANHEDISNTGSYCWMIFTERLYLLLRQVCDEVDGRLRLPANIRQLNRFRTAWETYDVVSLGTMQAM